MKRVRWTSHAEASLRDREIDRMEAERTLGAPERRIAGRGERVILVRKYEDNVLHQPMVLCVVVEERSEEEETVVVTVYKSSKLEKYLTGGVA